MKKKKSVVIVEDHVILRQGLRSLLDSSGEFEVVEEAEDGMEAIRVIQEKNPDLVLLDISMPKMNGISVIQQISGTCPDTKILVLTMHQEEDYILETFQCGADGYCLKTTDYEELLMAAKAVLEGKSYVSPEISGKVLEGYIENQRTLRDRSSWDTLTPREKEVLKLVGEGYQNKEIANYLCISIKTVEKHRSNIMEKVNLHSASALTSYAIEKGLVTR